MGTTANGDGWEFVGFWGKAQQVAWVRRANIHPFTDSRSRIVAELAAELQKNTALRHALAEADAHQREIDAGGVPSPDGQGGHGDAGTRATAAPRQARRCARRNRVSGYTGVIWRPNSKVWVVGVGKVYGGTSKDLRTAVELYNAVCRDRGWLDRIHTWRGEAVAVADPQGPRPQSHDCPTFPRPVHAGLASFLRVTQQAAAGGGGHAADEAVDEPRAGRKQGSSMKAERLPTCHRGWAWRSPGGGRGDAAAKVKQEPCQQTPATFSRPPPSAAATTTPHNGGAAVPADSCSAEEHRRLARQFKIRPVHNLAGLAKRLRFGPSASSM